MTANNIEAAFPTAIDATMRSAFLTCPHLFFRRHCQGLTTLEQISINLHFGLCFAKGLEASRRVYVGGEKMSTAVTTGAEAIIQKWGSYEFNPHTRDQEAKSLDHCLLALSDYFQQWPLDSDPVRIHIQHGEPCIEFSGALPIPGTQHPDTGEPIVYAGRFDLIGNYGTSIWGLDDKTGTSMGDATKWALRGQFSGYCWLARGYGLPLSGFLVREVQPLLRATTKLNQVITPRPPWMIDQWLRQLQADVDRMMGAWWRYERTGYDTTRSHMEHPFHQVLDSGCYAYNRPCEMTPLCTSEHPERWLDTYKIDRWNPLGRDTTNESQRIAAR